jgi:hypothetical protein
MPFIAEMTPWGFGWTLADAPDGAPSSVTATTDMPAQRTVRARVRSGARVRIRCGSRWPRRFRRLSNGSVRGLGGDPARPDPESYQERW